MFIVWEIVLQFFQCCTKYIFPYNIFTNKVREATISEIIVGYWQEQQNVPLMTAMTAYIHCTISVQGTVGLIVYTVEKRCLCTYTFMVCAESLYKMQVSLLRYIYNQCPKTEQVVMHRKIKHKLDLNAFHIYFMLLTVPMMQ